MQNPRPGPFLSASVQVQQLSVQDRHPGHVHEAPERVVDPPGGRGFVRLQAKQQRLAARAKGLARRLPVQRFRCKGMRGSRATLAERVPGTCHLEQIPGT